MKRLIFLAVAVLALAGFRSAAAEQVTGLYEAEVLVADQGTANRQAAMRLALEAILVRVSGHGSTPTDPALAEALATPERYAEQFFYRTNPVSAPAVPNPLPLTLSVRFSQSAIDQLLRSKGLNVWGSARPAALVWLAVEQGGERYLLGANESGAIHFALEAAAGARGLPLRLPLLDLEDQTRLQPAEVWGEFRDAIETASGRYQAQAILVGRLAELGEGQWQARWALYHGAQALRWEATGALEQVVDAGVGGSADELATAFARSLEGTGISTISLSVNGVRRLQDYMRVLDYLGHLAGVKEVMPTEVSGEQVTLKLSTRGSLSALVDTIALGDTLAAATAAPDDETGADLRYRLVP